jgi:hypothetical protein
MEEGNKRIRKTQMNLKLRIIDRGFLENSRMGNSGPQKGYDNSRVGGKGIIEAYK